MLTFDAVVLGTGGVGSAALYHLARRGVRAIGLDRFPAGHDRGSSHGQSRIIRQAYFEHPDYVPLLHRAYELWRDLQRWQETKLFYQVGLLEVGPADGVVVPGVLEAARQHNLIVDRLTPAESHKRFPALHVPDDCEAVFEEKAGYLLVEQCVQAHLKAAVAAGAEHQTGVDVRYWEFEGDSIRIQTDNAVYSAPKLIVTAGAWAGQLLDDLGIDFRVRRKHLHWYLPRQDVFRAPSCPTFFYELPGHRYYYGFPQIDDRGVKAAEHHGGEEVNDPLLLDTDTDHEERGRVAEFLRTHLPALSDRRAAHAVCMYTMSPDEHFVVDRHPEHPQVAFAAGLSGHGFKFTSVLGQALADLTLDGRTELPIDFLGQSRPGLR